uniref:RING-type domain-containing protein n=1 Tax=Leptocylindrus danicus TaxID=163516 RepID=A0A7S2JTG7_9STRA|mmetsp:Transcript_11404/g.17291  ORF Transcript_11404/g.17291 Transcript_11404/m.17291 type:complete len:275 (+) Transcript_11404:17-841(+)
MKLDSCAANTEHTFATVPENTKRLARDSNEMNTQQYKIVIISSFAISAIAFLVVVYLLVPFFVRIVDYLLEVMFANRRRKMIQKMLVYKKVRVDCIVSRLGKVEGSHEIEELMASKENKNMPSYSSFSETANSELRDIPICAICWGQYLEGEGVCWCKYNACTHVFHSDCLSPWLKKHNECPCCRQNMLQFCTGKAQKNDPNSEKNKKIIGLSSPNNLKNFLFCQIHGIVPRNHFDTEEDELSSTRVSRSVDICEIVPAEGESHGNVVDDAADC